ncbi:MAG TPA: hypothetical protein VJA21_09540 [Verrucomicrobiae bacterium]
MKSRAGSLIMLLLLGCLTGITADTNRVRVGLFPFANLSGDDKFEAWRKVLPRRLESGLADATPPRLKIYLGKVLLELTNNAWDGRQAISSELAGKVARELRLDKIVVGSFNCNEAGWEVQVRIEDPGADSRARVLDFKETSTQNLLAALEEKVCEPLGVKPSAARLQILRKHPVSNEAMDRVVALAQMEESGGSKEEVINGLRTVLASEPDYVSARVALVRSLMQANRTEEGLTEARKLVEQAPEMCWGHFSVAVLLRGREMDDQRDQALQEALKVHPGCPSAARLLFPEWAGQGRWEDLKRVAAKAHEALPHETVSTAALAAALAGQGEQEAAWQLLQEIGARDEEDDDVAVHSLLFSAAVATRCSSMLSRELLWLQRCAGTNEWVRKVVTSIDESFFLAPAADNSPTSPPARRFSPQELQHELARRLTPEEIALVENPLVVTDEIAAQARTLTSGLTNPATKAVVLLAQVIEERVQTGRQQATNLAKTGRLPVCHQYASRLVSLARSVGLSSWLVHAELADEKVSGYHDRAAIRLGDDLVMQFDPSLGALGLPRDKFRILDDVQAIAHHLLQEDDLPKVRIARKLDPDDPWSRVQFILRLINLDQVEEAERLWNALEPAYTNRWDYHFSRAGLEAKRHRYRSALEWLTRADTLSRNNPEVQYHLGRVYAALDDTGKSAEHLEKALKLGAALGELSRRAELELAVKFSRGVAQAGRMTEEDLRNRATAGDLHAQMVLAGKLLDRREKDEALKWLLAAAKQGDALAQENHGRILYELKGSSAATEAVEWLRKSALQGHSAADYLLAKLLYAGVDVPKNEVEASMWAHVGSAAGDDKCRWLVKEMQLLMDATAFAEGKKRAEAMLAVKERSDEKQTNPSACSGCKCRIS